MSKRNNKHDMHNNPQTTYLSMTKDPIEDNDFQKQNNAIQSIKVIGVGGGGNNAVEHMFKQGIKDVSFVLVNTDRMVIDSSEVPTKLVIGPGLGAGGRPEVGAQYAEENATKIAEIFEDSTDMVFITAGMGGGTGTGAGPVIARMAKEKGILTVGIVTLPFLFEGQKRILKALDGAGEMAKNVDALLVINNQRLTEIYPEETINESFGHANDTLLNAAKSITDIITKRGSINRDFKDVNSTLRDGGTAIISSGYGSGEHRVTKAIQDALHSPLLKDTDISSSKKMLIIVYQSTDAKHQLKTKEIEELTEFVTKIESEVEVPWGLYEDEDLTDQVKITILASGFDVTTYNNDVKDNIKKPEPINNPTERITDQYGSGATSILHGKVQIIDPEHLDDEETMATMETPPTVRRRQQHVTSSAPQQTTKEKNDATDNNNAKYIDFNDI